MNTDLNEKEIQAIKALADKTNDVPVKQALRIVSEDTLVTMAKTEKGFTSMDVKFDRVNDRITGLFVFLTVVTVAIFLMLLSKRSDEQSPNNSAKKK